MGLLCCKNIHSWVAIRMKQLQVRIGSSLESLSLINPNDESNPVKISNDYFKGQALMRIKNFRGKVPNGQETIANSEYFNGKKHRFSLLVQGEFLKKYTAEDIVWTAQWEKPLNIPSYFTKFWHMVAPHSMVELSGPAPYVQSFAITASSLIQTWDHVLDKLSLNIIEDINSIIPSHVEMKKKKSYFYTQETMMVSARRRLFCIKENRESILFGPGNTVGILTFKSSL
jgi:hypothetical protein